jgi:hypothetical protein
MNHNHLNNYQKKILNKIKRKTPGEPFPPWNRGIINYTAGIILTGWTNRNKLLLVTNDDYFIVDPKDGSIVLESSIEPGLDFLLNDNLRYWVPEYKEFISVFGPFGGEGNHTTTDGWHLEVIYPFWPNSIVTMKKPRELGKIIAPWEDLMLISLKYLEYSELHCGFSPNGDFFVISNSHGAEIFYR